MELAYSLTLIDSDFIPFPDLRVDQVIDLHHFGPDRISQFVHILLLREPSCLSISNAKLAFYVRQVLDKACILTSAATIV